ncbi:glycoside hydrolase family 26 protein [Planctomonas deserti]|uniref:glycoside hydrolase family 26 protein n=1 Tax=Planctomonas deserti TaxID=2144185 RepID=UPI000D3C883F|nr:glycosyl hydrolase [Planctomonas deserti]
MPRKVLAGISAAACLLALTGCNISKYLPAEDCVVVPAEDLVPATGALLGVNLDWGSETLSEYADKLGHRPSVAVSFSDLPLSNSDEVNVRAAAAQVRGNGGSLLVTLEPHAGLASITPEVADELAAFLAEINAEGVPVIVRFAHEMNGSWYEWGQQPTAYIAAFRIVAEALHAGAPGSATMWAPNNAGGYPFTGGKASAVPGTADFALLDTNGDGTLTIADDSYAPYYPGDDVVDWVGMSLYHWGSTYPWGENEMPEEGKFAAQLTGTYNGLAGDETAAPDFYQTYAVEHGKPLAIPETAALVIPGQDAEQELAIKRAWWRQVLSEENATRFPQLKMVNWFEWDKDEPEVGGDVHWSVANDADVRTAFTADLPSWLAPTPVPEECAPVTSEQ